VDVTVMDALNVTVTLVNVTGIATAVLLAGALVTRDVIEARRDVTEAPLTPRLAAVHALAGRAVPWLGGAFILAALVRVIQIF
jgi:hypothetical protein